MATDFAQAQKGKVAQMVDRLSRIDASGGNIGPTIGLPILADPDRKISPSPPVFPAMSAMGEDSQPKQQLGQGKGTTRIVLVRFSYAAQHDDELDLQEGDRVEVLEDVEDGWARGRLIRDDGTMEERAVVGVFPTNFVSDENNVQPEHTGPSEIPLHQQHPSNGVSDAKDALLLKGPNWAKNDGGGQKNATQGTPSPSCGSANEPPAFRMPVKPIDSPTGQTKELARVMYKYEAANSDELSLPEGVLVTILRKNCEDEGWYEGEYQGKRGLFPENFVRLVDSATSTLPTAERTLINPPQLPAKPSKAGVRTHQRTASSGGNEPVVHLRSTAAPPESDGPAKHGNSPNKAPPPLLPHGTEPERKSMVANLQNILFRDGKLPPKKPPISHHQQQETAAPIAESGNSVTTAEPATGDSSNKLDSLTKMRPRQANKRPPSMNFHISTAPQKAADSPDSPTATAASQPMSGDESSPVSSQNPGQATKQEPVEAKTEKKPSPPTAVGQATNGLAHQHAPARPSPLNFPPLPSITHSQRPHDAQSTAGGSLLSAPHSCAMGAIEQSEWIPRVEFERFKEGVEAKLKEMNKQILHLRQCLDSK